MNWVWGVAMNTELTTAITDLLVAVLCLASVVIICLLDTEKKRHKKIWVRMFVCLTVACSLGYVFHRFTWGDIGHGILWTFLYPAMFEATHCTLLLGLDIRYGDARPTRWENRILWIAEGLLCLFAVLLRYQIGRNSLILFIVFATVIAALSILQYGRALKQRSVEAWFMFFSLIAVAPAIAVQYRKTAFIHLIWDFDHNGISHLFLILAIGLAACGAILELRETIREKNSETIPL